MTRHLPTTCLVGVGGFGRILLPKLKQRSELVLAVNRTMGEAALRACGDVDVPITSNLEEIPDSVEWVAIATPISSHASLTRYCLESGRNVYCQKPLCQTEEEARELFELASKRSLKLFVDEVFLYRDGFDRLVELGAGVAILEAEFRWEKAGPGWDPIPNALTYHDLYLAVALGVLQDPNPSWIAAEVSKDRLDLRLDSGDCRLRFSYDRSTDLGPRKRVRLLLEDGRCIVWENREVAAPAHDPYIERTDALDWQLQLLFGDEIDVAAAERRAIEATRYMQQIMDEPYQFNATEGS